MQRGRASRSHILSPFFFVQICGFAGFMLWSCNGVGIFHGPVGRAYHLRAAETSQRPDRATVTVAHFMTVR